MTIDEKQVKELEENAVVLMKKADALVIKNQTDYEAAAFELDGVKSLAKKIENFFEPHVKRAHDVWKGLTTDRKKHLDPLAQVERIIKSKMADYYEEQKRIEAEKQRKAEEAARAEEERQRKIKEEQERKWREKEEAKRKEAERLAAEGREEEARKAQEAAEKAAAKADERAEEAMSVQVEAQIVAPQVDKVKGVKTIEVWNYEVVDFSKIPDLFKMVDDAKIRKQVSALKQDAPMVIPGIKVIKSTRIASGGVR